MDSHAVHVLEFDRIRELVAERCVSPLGRAVAAELEPSADREAIRLSLAQTDEARRLLVSGSPLPISGIEDIGRLVAEAHRGQRPLEPAELLRLARTLRRAEDLRVFLRLKCEVAPELASLAEQFLSHEDFVVQIDRAIETPGIVADAASERLWEIRRAIRRLEDEVRLKLASLLERPSIRAAVQNPNVTIRGGRFVIGVRLDMKGHVPGIVHGRSQTGATVFIEPSEIVPMTNEVRERRSEETNEENRILWELTRTAFARRNGILHTANLLAWLDFSNAKAVLAREFGLRVPDLSPDGSLRIKEARHPLLLVTAGGAADVVPLDVRLREGFRILVITGPNTGGKTVTLKTVGLLQLMFQAGVPVPVAEGSRMPVFERIFADIGDEQSISQSLSTFSGHVRNIASILESADRRTLVLLDELGAGTDPAEGAALGGAILEELRNRESAVIVTTHLGSLKEFAFRHPDVENACVEFDPETMSPTYRLIIGQPGNSNALVIARRCGLPEPILDRARELVDRGDHPGQEMIDQLMESRVALERERQLSEKHLQRSLNLNRAADERQRHLEKRSARVDREGESLLDETFRTFISAAGPFLRELQNVPKALRPAIDGLAELIRVSFRKTSLAQRRREFIATLKKSDSVFVPRLGQVCRIKKFNRAEETISVLVNQMTMEISYDDVSWVPPREGVDP